MNAELRREPAPDEGAGNSDNEIAAEPEACSLQNLTCEPSGYETNNEHDQQAIT